MQRLSGPTKQRGVTLVETLVATAILALILVIVLQLTTQVSQTWRTSAMNPWSEAEDAFARMSQEVSTATLEPYLDYVDAQGTSGVSSPTNHPARYSDLAFVCGPGLLPKNRVTAGDGIFFIAAHGYSQTQAHAGLNRLLNAEGYVVEFDNDSGPLASQPKWRWRLKEVLQPSENLAVFTTSSSAEFLQSLLRPGSTEPTLADNVIALLALPERLSSDPGPTLAPAFQYDSRDTTQPLTHHQLPSRIKLVLVAINEISAQGLAEKNGNSAPALLAPELFQEADALAQDLATLDASLMRQKVEHRIYQRDVLLSGAAWAEVGSP